MKTPDQRSGKSSTSNTQSAFSLVEMLVVIAVIATVSAIAIPTIGMLNESSTEAKDRRNAQNIASVFASAQAAGLDFFVTGDKAATVKAVVAGDTVTEEGPFYGAYFGMPGITTESQLNAANYLEMDEADRTLIYLTKVLQ